MVYDNVTLILPAAVLSVLYGVGSNNTLKDYLRTEVQTDLVVMLTL